MKRVILESPYRVNQTIKRGGISGVSDVYEIKIIQAKYKIYACKCVIDCLGRDESPFASHLIFTQMLDDNISEHRQLGMEAGFTWYSVADYCVVYNNYGISEGMQKGIIKAEQAGLRIHYRKIHV